MLSWDHHRVARTRPPKRLRGARRIALEARAAQREQTRRIRRGR